VLFPALSLAFVLQRHFDLDEIQIRYNILVTLRITPRTNRHQNFVGWKIYEYLVYSRYRFLQRETR
jgi:hypothetical protein